MNNITDNLPIFVRIAEGIKDYILSGELKEGEQITSTTRIANDYNINIATVNKGFNLLVDDFIYLLKRDRSKAVVIHPHIILGWV